MPIRTTTLALLALLCLPLAGLAQTTDPEIASDAAGMLDEESDELNVGALQAELAELEAERQRLADALAAGADSLQAEQLAAQNSDLQERLSIMQAIIDGQRRDQQQKWFIVGGSTVGVSLVLGWLLARLGGSRKRSMWTN